MELKRARRLLGALAVAVLLANGGEIALAAAAGTASSLSSPAQERHCIIDVRERPDGVLVRRGEERCYATFAQVQEDVRTGKADHRGQSAELQNNAIGTHFMGTSFTGSSISITGTTCAGGVWYPTGAWDNNIASSFHYCGSAPTRFYDSSSCAGTSHAIYSAAATLASMSDRTSCIRYG